MIRRDEGEGAGHHGGAWKVAYADFVTAMMAFFLLMWLLNATTEDQRKGLADYFAPNGALSHNTSGSGAPFGGRTPFETGSLVSDRGAMTVMPGKATAPVQPDGANSPTSAQFAPARVEDDDDEAGETASAQVVRGGPSRGDLIARAGTARRPLEGDARGSADTDEDETRETGPDDPSAARRGPSARSARARPTVSGAEGGSVVAASTDDTSGATSASSLPSPSGTMELRATQQTAARPSAAQQRAVQQREAERQAFEQLAEDLRALVRADRELAALANQISIDQTPEGLRIQLLDEDRQAMFATGSADPVPRARLALRKMAPLLARLPEPVSISGHTDAEPYRGGDKTNWELSAERALATRRLLVDGGVAESRIKAVSGSADRDLLLPADPLAAANRRIAIVMLRTRQ